MYVPFIDRVVICDKKGLITTIFDDVDNGLTLTHLVEHYRRKSILTKKISMPIWWIACGILFIQEFKGLTRDSTSHNLIWFIKTF